MTRRQRKALALELAIMLFLAAMFVPTGLASKGYYISAAMATLLAFISAWCLYEYGVRP